MAEETFGTLVNKARSKVSATWDWMNHESKDVEEQKENVKKKQPTQKTARDTYGIGTGAIYD